MDRFSVTRVEVEIVVESMRWIIIGVALEEKIKQIRNSGKTKSIGKIY